MTEPEAAPEAAPGDAEAVATAPEATQPFAAPRRSVLPWLCLLGFLALAGGIAFVWLYPRASAAPDAAGLAALNSRLDQLAGQLAATEKRLAALPSAPDLGPIEQHLTTLEKRLAALPSSPDLGPIEARLTALENRPPPAALPPTAAQMGAALAPLADHIDALGKSLAGLTARLDKIERLARAGAAAVALEQGRPLGHLPGAPPALARFAAVAPPTLATLRLSFAHAARAESAAARPSGRGQPFLKQILLRLGDLFTLRQGNRVIIGNPATTALADAGTALEAGDLAAALAALASLPSPLAPAMAEWEDQAKALLAAESAMATFADSD